MSESQQCGVYEEMEIEPNLEVNQPTYNNTVTFNYLNLVKKILMCYFQEFTPVEITPMIETNNEENNPLEVCI